MNDLTDATGPEASDTREEAADEARRAVQEATLRHVSATGGQILDQPVWPGRDYGTIRDAEPTAGIALRARPGARRHRDQARLHQAGPRRRDRLGRDRRRARPGGRPGA